MYIYWLFMSPSIFVSSPSLPTIAKMYIKICKFLLQAHLWYFHQSSRDWAREACTWICMNSPPSYSSLRSDQFGTRTNSIRSAVPEIFQVKGSCVFDRNSHLRMRKRTTFCTRIWQKNWTTPVRFTQKYLGFYLTVLNRTKTIQLRIQRWIFVDPYQNCQN